MENRSHLTAISRKDLSLPVRWLKKQGLLQGRMLDYGRGFDCDCLSCEGYDPYYRPIVPEGKFNTIFCVYVLNILPDPKEREDVLDSIGILLENDGKAYIAVRLGMKEGWTSRKTYQGLVELDLPVIKKCSTFRIHEMNEITRLWALACKGG